jgi:hypothetical protein
MFSEEEAYDSDEAEEAAFAAEEAHAAEEIEQSRIAGAFEARQRFEDEATLAQGIYENQVVCMNAVGLRRFPRQKPALVLARTREASSTNRQLVFAVDRPVVTHATETIKYVKEYVVGSKVQLFRYAHGFHRHGVVVFDELVPADKPTPVHFDVEIKRMPVGGMDDGDWLALLESHVKVVKDVQYDNAKLGQIVQAYRAISSMNWTPEECAVGLEIILAHVTDVLRRLLPDDVHEASGEFGVLTGCRENKLSFHILVKRVYCDSTVLTMALVVFEIARLFVVDNTTWLLGCDLDERDAETTFRIRALMLSEMAEKNGEKWLFKGFDDSPFDEAIYAANHLLRAPGGCKRSTRVPGMAPVERGVMGVERNFGKMFPETDAGLISWGRYLLSDNETSSLAARVLLRGWKPSAAFPAKRRWYGALGKSQQNQHGGEFRQVSPANMVGYVVYSEERPTRQRPALSREDIRRARSEAGGHDDRELVEPGDLFRAETGGVKEFRLFRPDEWLYHKHDGVLEESSPSAKVFLGGFRCFGCNKTYGVLRTTASEENYPFAADEIVESDDPHAYMGSRIDIDWASRLRKKWCVISAPMGAGKTRELEGLMDIAHRLGKRVCVVSFRRVLALQQSQRLGAMCYLDASSAGLEQGAFQFLVICVNSLYKLGDVDYDYVVLDECGLIRRHFLSTTCVDVLGKVFERFVNLIKNASFVVMCQDGISRDDVQFYTELDDTNCDDRARVSALWFKKPIVIHPIRFTTDHVVALLKLQEKYKGSFRGGICVHPFMVFCSHKTYAEYIVEMLQECAGAIEGADPDRVKGMWSANRDKSEFCVKFSIKPNEVAAEADVMVCTSVVGAGFSINTHFQAFFAFLFNRILQHNEEQQFIRRLRFLLDDIPEDAQRDSILFVEKGSGSQLEYGAVLRDYSHIRKQLMAKAGVRDQRVRIMGLEQTQARVATERAHTFANHHDLWSQWGETIKSEFVQMESVDAAAKNAASSHWKRWGASRKADIRDMVAGIVVDENEDVGNTLAQLEVGSNINAFRFAVAEDIVVDFKAAFLSENVAHGLVEKGFPIKVLESCTGSAGGSATLIQKTRKLAVWILFYFSDVSPRDKVQTIWKHMESRKYSSGCTGYAHLHLAKWVLPRLFTTEEGEFLDGQGFGPFYTGVRIFQEGSLCLRLRGMFVAEENDSPAAKAGKNKRMVWLRMLLGDHTNGELRINKVMTDAKAAYHFVKALLFRIGLKMRSTTKRKNSKTMYAMDASPAQLALVFALKGLGSNVVEVLQLVMQGQADNLSQGDQDFVADAAFVHNKVIAEKGFGDDMNVIFRRSQPAVIVPVVCPARLRLIGQEHQLIADRQEEEGGGDWRLNEMDTARDLIAMATATSEQAEYEAEQAARGREMAAARYEEVYEEDEGGATVRTRRPCRFIDDAASDSDE